MQRKDPRRTIAALQAQSEALRFRDKTARKMYLGYIPQPKTCQWLYGEPSERNFCCELVQSGSSYCPTHHKVTHLPLTEKAQQTG